MADDHIFPESMLEMNTKVTETATKVDFLASRAEEDRRLLSNIATSVATIVGKFETFMGFGTDIKTLQSRVTDLESWRHAHLTETATANAERNTFWRVLGGSWTQILQIVSIIALLGAAFWHR